MKTDQPGLVGKAIIRVMVRFQRAHLRQRHGTDIRQTMEDEWRAERDAGREARFWIRLIALGTAAGIRGRLEPVRESLRAPGFALHVRMTLRSMASSPLFVATGVLTLALGIGGSTALFAMGRALLWTPLPFEEPETLLRVTSTRSTGNETIPWLMSHADFLDIRGAGGPLDGIAIRSGARPLNLTGAAGPESVGAEFVSAGYFELLGAEPALGRWFGPEADRPGAPAVAVLAHHLWQARYGGEPTVVGRSITLNERPYEVVGVAREGFDGDAGGADLWVPVSRAAEVYDDGYVENRRLRWLTGLARSTPGADPAVADAWLRGFGVELAERYPDTNRNHGFRAVPLRDAWYGDRFLPLLAAGLTTLLTLLVVALNLAGLQVARGLADRRDLAVCRALGASSAVLRARLTVTSASLAVGGLVLSLLLADWAVTVANSSQVLASRSPVAIGTPEAVVAVLLAVLATVVMGAAGHAAGGRRAVTDITRSQGVASGGRLRGALIGGQVAVTTTLCVVAVLLGGSFNAIRSFDIGLEPDGLYAFGIDLLGPSWEEGETRVHLAESIREELRAYPSIDAVAVAGPGGVPGAGLFGFYFTMERDGVPDWREEPFLTSYHSVSPGYFETMGLTLLEGRPISADDRSDAAGAVVVTRALARRVWPDGRSLGRLLRLGTSTDAPEFRVVGVVEDPALEGRTRNPELAGPEHVFVPLAQEPPSRPARLQVIVRSRGGDPTAATAALRDALPGIAPDLPAGEPRDIAAYLHDQTANDRFLWLASVGFAVLALLLATLGIYSMASDDVARRRLELGIRLAIGADPARLGWAVLRGSAMRVAAGLVVGIFLALLVARLIRGMLFEIQPFHPGALMAVSVSILAAAVVGSAVPAWRAIGPGASATLLKDTGR